MVFAILYGSVERRYSTDAPLQIDLIQAPREIVSCVSKPEYQALSASSHRWSPTAHRHRRRTRHPSLRLLLLSIVTAQLMSRADSFVQLQLGSKHSAQGSSPRYDASRLCRSCEGLDLLRIPQLCANRHVPPVSSKTISINRWLALLFRRLALLIP